MRTTKTVAIEEINIVFVFDALQLWSASSGIMLSFNTSKIFSGPVTASQWLRLMQL